MLRELRGIIGATVLLLASFLTDVGERIIGEPEKPEPREPELDDDEPEVFVADCRQDPLTPEAAAMLATPRPNTRPAATAPKPLAGSIESRLARMRAF